MSRLPKAVLCMPGDDETGNAVARVQGVKESGRLLVRARGDF